MLGGGLARKDGPGIESSAAPGSLRGMEAERSPRKCNICKDEKNLNQKAYETGGGIFLLCWDCDGLAGWPHKPKRL